MYLIKSQWVYIATVLMFSPKSFRKQWVLFKVIMPKVTLFILGHLQTIILDQSLPEALEQTVMDPQFQKHGLGRTRSRHCWLWTLKVMMWTLERWYKHMTVILLGGQHVSTRKMYLLSLCCEEIQLNFKKTQCMRC